MNVLMPHMGVSVEEATVLTWHKAVGDAVTAEEVVCEVAGDKVDVEVLAPADGVLATILVAEGETAKVGTPIAELAAAGATIDPAAAPNEPATIAPAAPPAAASNGPATIAPPEAAPAVAGATNGPALAAPAFFDPAAEAAAAVPVRDGGRPPVASPVARRIAAAHGVDLEGVNGTGLRGRISKADVLAATTATSAAPTAPAPLAAAPAGDAPVPGYEGVPYEIVTTTRRRRAIAEHMIRSRQTSAHMTTEVEVDMLRAAQARALINERRSEGGRRRLTYLALIARATAVALADHPDLNATFQVERTIRWRDINLGIAVDTDQGLIVPVIHRAQDLTAPALADAIAGVAERARGTGLRPEDLAGGTFTISNPGSVGAHSAMAIINQPQVAILGIPVIVRRPVVVPDAHGGESIAIRPMLRLALTFDHRAVDGAEATRCLVRIAQHLEGWDADAYS